MTKGIIIFGSPGSGKTTLGRAVSEQLGYLHIDLDDFLWLKDTEIPFTVTRPRNELTKLLMDEISKCTNFVMSGSMDSYNAPFVPMFDLAVLNSAPVELRVDRVNARELSRFGNRILPGGDMFETHKNFLEMVCSYDANGSLCRSVHEQWALTLPCPVLYIDGSEAITTNVVKIVEQYLAHITV